MTVSTTDSSIDYDGNGSTTAFPVPFRFLNNSDLVVTLVNSTGESSTLVMGTDYSVIGAGAQSGGAIMMTLAPAKKEALNISRVLAAVQGTDLRNQGRFYAETHENVFDYLTMLVQQGFAGLARALKRPVGKSYFDAESRLVSNVADPVQDQDAATKGWASRYFGSLVDGATGLVNTTTGILYDAGTLFDYLRFGVGRTVDSIAALRLLSGSRNQRAFVLGYYAKGDGGGGVYFIDPLDTVSVDNGGTIIVAADGARWKLSFQGNVAAEVFGIRPGVAFNNTPLMVAAHSTGLTIQYAAKTYEMQSRFVLSGNFSAECQGAGKTVFNFTGASQGFLINQTDGTVVVSVRGGFTVKTSHTPAALEYGFKVDGSSQISGNDGAGHGVLQPRTNFRCSIDHVECLGVDDSCGWYVGTNMHSVMNFRIGVVGYRGVVSTTSAYNGVAIMVSGDGVPVDWSIQRAWAYYAAYVVLMPDYLEGGHIGNVEGVHVTRGVYGAYDASFSTLPAGVCGILGMFLGDIHINCRLMGVYLENTNQNRIRDLNIYLNPLAADATAFGLLLSNGSDNSVGSVNVNGASALNTKANNPGISLRQIANSKVFSSQMTGGASVVAMDRSTGNDIFSCSAIDCVNAVTGNGASTGNQMYKNKGSNLSGPKYVVADANNILRERYDDTIIKTLVGGAASEVVSIPIPAGYFSVKPKGGKLTLNGGASNQILVSTYDYDNASNSSTQMMFVVKTAGGSNIAAGGYRFSIEAYE